MTTETSWRNKSLGEIFSRSPATASARTQHTAVLPQVNLLPADITEAIALRKIRRATLLVGMLILVVTAFIWALQIPAVTASQDSLATAQATNAREQAQVQALAPIAQMVTQIQRQEALVNTTLAAQPRAAAIYRRLLTAAAGAGGPAIRFTTLAATYAPASAPDPASSACPNPDPFARHISIGCVTFSATAGSREQVSRLLVALSRDPIFVGPYVNSSMLAGAAVGGRQAVTFTGTVGLSPVGLATPLTKEQAALLLNPPAAGGTPSITGGSQ